MSFLLDTDICSAHLRRPGGLSHRFIQHAGRLHVSTVVWGELHAGAFHLPNPQPLLSGIVGLLADLQVLPFDQACAEEFGKIRGSLLQHGVSVPSLDLMIAATALVHNLTLVTHNTNDYRHISGLRLDDWILP